MLEVSFVLSFVSVHDYFVASSDTPFSFETCNAASSYGFQSGNGNYPGPSHFVGEY